MNCHNCGNKARENQVLSEMRYGNPKLAEHEIIEKPSQEVVSAEPWKAPVIETGSNKTEGLKTAVFMIIGVMCCVFCYSRQFILCVVCNLTRISRSSFTDEIGKYSEAAAAFSTLDLEYKDVEEKLAECNAMISYQQAADLMSSGSYTNARYIYRLRRFQG
jgi:hypothetical protein